MRFHLTLGISILASLGVACREDAPTLDKQVLISQQQPDQENDDLSGLSDSAGSSDANTAKTKTIASDATLALAYNSSDDVPIEAGLQGAALTSVSNQFNPAVAGLYTVANGSVQKGKNFSLVFTLSNNSSVDGEVKLTPTLTSAVYTDFDNVSLGTKAVKIPAGGAVKVAFDVPVYIQDPATKANFAVGPGHYDVGTTLEFGKEKRQGRPWYFHVADSNAVLALVIYDKDYFQVGEAKGADPQKWMQETFTRKSSLYDPATNQKKVYARGFDEMMNVRHMFKMVEVSSSDIPANIPHQEQVKQMATKLTGMSHFWANAVAPADRHGYDYAIGLFNGGWGGVRIGAVTAISSGFPGDRSKGRMQMLIVHESGHMFGAPHCNPTLGYVMCSGEKNDAYKKDREFVWHQSSVDRMRGNLFLQTK